MTTELTVHDRVMQAVQRDAELADQLLAFKDALLKAKQAEDAIRKSSEYNDQVAAFKTKCEEDIAAAKAVYDAAIVKATIPLKMAQQKYAAAESAAQGPFAKANDDATGTMQSAVAAAARAHELVLAEARATVHRLEQEIAAHRTTIDQHRRNIQERLGLNLGNLMGV